MPRVDAPAGRARCHATAQLRFLHVQAMLDPAAVAAMHREVRRRRRHQRTGMHDRALPWVMQHRMEIVDPAAAFALHRQIGIDRLRPSEQHQHLVQQVRAKVVPQAAAGSFLFAPAIAHLRPVAVEMRMAFGHLAQRALGQQRLQGEEIRIEAPVLEHRGDAPGIARGGQHRFRFGHVQRERLVDQHVLAGGQCGNRQRRVLLVRRGDHHRVHGGVIKHLLRGGAHVHITEAAQQGVALRTDDAVQGKPGRVLDERGVEDTAGQAVADQGQLQVGAHGGRSAGWGRQSVERGYGRGKTERLPMPFADSRQRDPGPTRATQAPVQTGSTSRRSTAR